MRKKKALPIIENITIEEAGAEGKAIVHVDGLVIFVPFVVPGDIVDLQLTKKKKNYGEGRAIAIRKASEKRVERLCRHFTICGGCKWQTYAYEEQLKAKQKQVRDNLERLGHIDCRGMLPIVGSEQTAEYRNKLEYTFSAKEWKTEPYEAGGEGCWGALGFHIPTMFDKVLNIERCVLQAEPSNKIRNAVRAYAQERGLPCYDIRNHTGFLRNLIIRSSSTGEWMVIVVVAERREEWLYPLLDHIATEFEEVTSLQYIINDKYNDSYGDLEVVPYRGAPYIMEEMEGYAGGKTLKFRITPKSFYQTNSRQAQRLYSKVAEMAGLQGGETVYDLYTGTGTIAHFVAERCRRVVGIEYVEEAIGDARANAELNGHGNTTFYAGDMAKVLTDDFIAANGKPDIVITDPPRAGMHESVVEQLMKTAPEKIIYVSCNPATQARDVSLMQTKYRVGRIQPVDMFPHTQHVENIIELIKKTDDGQTAAD